MVNDNSHFMRYLSACKESAQSFLRDFIISIRELGFMLFTFITTFPRKRWNVIRPCRVAFWFSFVFSLLVLVNDQFIDVLQAFETQKVWELGGYWGFMFGLFFFSLTTWYWARSVLYVAFPSFTPGVTKISADTLDQSTSEQGTSKQKGALKAISQNLALSDIKNIIRINEKENEKRAFELSRTWTARWIGLLPIATLALQFSLIGNIDFSILFIIAFFSFLLFVVFRRNIALKWLENMGKVGDKKVGRVGVYLHPNLKAVTISILGLWMLAYIFLGITFLVSRVAIPQLLGPLGVFLLASIGLVAFFTILTYINDRNTHWVSLSFSLLILAVIFGLWNDNHELRQIRSSKKIENDKIVADFKKWKQGRADVQAHFDRWINHRLGGKKSENYPVYVVAAEGGGIRAAYWTAAVLTELQKQLVYLNFGCHLFAVSGVSGGSLGGTTFVADVANAYRIEKTNCSFNSTNSGEQAHEEEWKGVSLQFLGKDFLSPTIAGMMTLDLISRINFACIKNGFLCAPDRAEFLELAWEEEWNTLIKARYKEGKNLVGFSNAFEDIWSQAGLQAKIDQYPELSIPSLFLNGTWVETGERNVTSNLRSFTSNNNSAQLDDIFGWLDNPIRVSTAVLNSARFTYVSPPGTVHRDGETRKIVDGGYFENSGTLTAKQIIQTIKGACDKNPSCKQNNIKFIAIILTNNPERNIQEWGQGKEILYVGNDDEPKQSNYNDGLLGDLFSEVVSPIRALLNSRDARGQLSETELNLSPVVNEVVRFSLRKDKEIDFPLGWVLSQKVQDKIKEQAKKAVTEYLNDYLGH